VLQPADLVPRLAPDVCGQVALGDVLAQDAELGQRVGDEAREPQRQGYAQHHGDRESDKHEEPGVLKQLIGHLPAVLASGHRCRQPLEALEGLPSQEAGQ
jgi:hypothetical protein